ncbi:MULTISPECIES: sulfur carrier protein ThiS [Thalassotalea]|uniref:sulfur carrier protein ThiS n=1 Tax=Thalassotalea TaxID=1518149 RepID=UPI00094217AB|nr:MULTISPECIES: sulfur carrier protein ThiS [Thalassotalea]OKY25111.1 thiamine biosynthesis protein ThiS [Thalassotalea sp. PP2-459]
MNIFINGEQVSLFEQASVADALQQYLTEQQQALTFAVALNSDFVANSDYATTCLTEHDTLDVLFPIQGG